MIFMMFFNGFYEIFENWNQIFRIAQTSRKAKTVIMILAMSMVISNFISKIGPITVPGAIVDMGVFVIIVVTVFVFTVIRFINNYINIVIDSQ